MAMFNAIEQAFEGAEHKQKVRKGIDDLGGVNGSIVVLDSD